MPPSIAPPPGAPPAGVDRETLDLTLDALRAFAREAFPDARLLDLDARDVFPVDDVRRLMGDGLGLGLLFMPEAHGGMGGGAVDQVRVCEELARVDLGVATGAFATFLGCEPILQGATAEQRERWLPQIADGALMAYAATEPEAGSDLGNLRTTARPVTTDGGVTGYVLNGAKQWISNGGYADLYSVLAMAPGGPCWFIVPSGTPGLEPGRPEDKHGIRASNTAAVTLVDVAVPADALVGGVEGQGLLQAQAVFGVTRLMVAAFGYGGGWAALDRAIKYSTERIQAGSPLAEKQGYTHKLIVPHAVRLEAARALTEETGERIDAGEGLLATEGAVAKLLGSEAGVAAADAAIQALGGYGYTREYMVEKVRRDVRITTIYEGTSEILETTIARDRWQLHLKTRGEHYHAEARRLEALAVANPESGAALAARVLHALAEVLERARIARATRHQHVLMRLGEAIAAAEGAAALVRRAVRAATGNLPAKANSRFDPPTVAAMARIAAREAALTVGVNAFRWVAAAIDSAPEAAALDGALGLAALLEAQNGALADMDRVADALYDRTAR